jgi:cephalosporin-C deacetylase-like acetyl esterase
MLPNLLLALASLQGQASDTLFQYLGSAPLHLQERLIRMTEHGVRISEMSFDSPRGGQVTGYLVSPPGPGPFAAILFGHWGLGNATEFLPEAIHYAERGAVSLLPDWPWVRQPPHRRDQGPLDKPETDLAVFAQAVVDLRRGLDVLLSRPGVDSARLGYIGHSYGAQFGAVMNGVDRRPRAVVLMAGIPDNATFLVESSDADMVGYRARWTREQLGRYMQVMAPLDAANWVGKIAPRALLMQFAEFERSIPMVSMRRYAAAAREPRTILWYPTGHELNDPKAWRDRTAWVAGQLRLGPAR